MTNTITKRTKKTITRWLHSCELLIFKQVYHAKLFEHYSPKHFLISKTETFT